MAIRNCLADLRNLGFSAWVGTSKFGKETLCTSKVIMGDRKYLPSVDKLCFPPPEEKKTFSTLAECSYYKGYRRILTCNPFETTTEERGQFTNQKKPFWNCLPHPALGCVQPKPVKQSASGVLLTTVFVKGCSRVGKAITLYNPIVPGLFQLLPQDLPSDYHNHFNNFLHVKCFRNEDNVENSSRK